AAPDRDRDRREAVEKPSSRAKPPEGRRSRGTCSCWQRPQEEVPPLRLAALGSGRDDDFCYFFFGFAFTPAIARTLAWWLRAALTSIGRSLPASSIFMPLPM